MALSMLALGAKGDTFSQLYQALGYAEMTPQTVNEAYEHILHMLGHNQENIQLDASNAVAVMEGAKVIDKFLEDAKHYYNSEAFSVDFSKPDVAVQEINKYIAQHTNNTITDMVKDVDKDNVMMLINCIYFRGEWETYFNGELTENADFHVDENTKVTVDMMQSEGEYEFYEEKENFITVLKLPYKGNASMMIILPDKGKLKEVEENIGQICIKEESVKKGSLIVRMPKMSITGKYSLKETLESMGVISAFTYTADFSGITSVKVKVSEVEHEAVLKVDEKGTEAAASTTITLQESLREDMEQKIININRPFWLYITDEHTRSILFFGKILNPTLT